MGGGIVNDDAETQAIVLRNLQEERTVVERLRAALPPPPGDLATLTSLKRADRRCREPNERWTTLNH